MKDTLRKIINSNKYLKGINRLRKGFTPVYIEYDVNFTPRWQDGKGNPHLGKVIAGAESNYKDTLATIEKSCSPAIQRVIAGDLPFTIDWRNHFIPALDGFSLMWAALQAKNTFMEIGSGNSTLFAKAALIHEQKATKIVSIDPHPRTEVDIICDEIIRSPLEKIDLAIFDRLGAGDTLFVDNSHRSFMNSDVTVFMLDVLPRLKSGVLVGIHDIFLPYDYFESWSERGYNEQYLLGCYLLSNPGFFDIRLANYWISCRKLHYEPFEEIWQQLGQDIRDRMSSAFWGIKT